MLNYYVVAANSSNARYFYLKDREIPEEESGPNLVEEEKLHYPEGELPDREVFSTPKSGRHRQPVGGSGAGHGYDDHRQEHRREWEKSFAEQVANKAVENVQKAGARKLIVASDSRMRGFFRPLFASIQKRGIKIIEHDADLVNQSTEAIHQHLARQKLVPAKKPPLGRS